MLTNPEHAKVIAQYESQKTALRTLHQRNYNDWEYISRFIDPISRETSINGEINDTTGNTNRYRRIFKFDTTATLSASILSSALFSYTFTPNQPFFHFKICDPDLVNDAETKALLQRTQDQLLDIIFNSPDTNIIDSYSMALDKLVLYGTCVMLVSAADDSEGKPITRVFDIQDCYIGVDSRGMPTRIFRMEKIFGNQLLDMFEAEIDTGLIHEEMITKWEKGFDQEFTMTHVVHKDYDYNPDEDMSPDKKPYLGVYYLHGTNTILRTERFTDFPYIVCPFKPATGNNPYGVSPGMECMEEIFYVNSWAKAEMEVVQLNTSGPLMIKANSLNARDLRDIKNREFILYNEDGVSQRPPIEKFPEYPGAGQLKVLIAEKQQIIRDFYKLNAVVPNRKAERENQEESQSNADSLAHLLQQIIARIERFILKRLIMRLLSVMSLGYYSKDVRAVTTLLKENKIEIKFNSRTNNIRNLAEVANVQGFIDIIARIPGGLESIEALEAIHFIADKLDINVGIIKTKATVRKEQIDRADAQAREEARKNAIATAPVMAANSKQIEAKKKPNEGDSNV